MLEENNNSTSQGTAKSIILNVKKYIDELLYRPVKAMNAGYCLTAEYADGSRHRFTVKRQGKVSRVHRYFDKMTTIIMHLDLDGDVDDSQSLYVFNKTPKFTRTLLRRQLENNVRYFTHEYCVSDSLHLEVAIATKGRDEGLGKAHVMRVEERT